ncbi:MAG: NAD(P)-binding domain-containing protein [Gemmatimonadota bacterium]
MPSGDSLLILVLGSGLAAAVMLPFLRRTRRREAATAQAELEALRYGLHEPASLHPVVDPALCIGVGNCIAACPEVDVLGMMKGQARPVKPAHCVGHGLCERVCPVDAISLVFGTETRGVDLPRIRENFETNVPGIYVIGELGGMGLIRNAFEQGRQCVAGIASEMSGENRTGDALDVLIVGCGPAGLSASLNCLHQNMRFVTIEKEDIGGTVRHYPRKKLVMTSPVTVPKFGKIAAGSMAKEELIELWEGVVAQSGLEVNTGETVDEISRNSNGLFTVRTSAGSYNAKRVILAIGRRGVPRKLGVPGEDAANVQYSLREPEAYQGDQILVVGGGDSAVEAALALAGQPGNTVRLSYRGETFSRIKPANHERVSEAIDANQLQVLWSTNPAAIHSEQVLLKHSQDHVVPVPSNQIFVFIGGELPTRFLRACGIEIETKFGQP